MKNSKKLLLMIDLLQRMKLSRKQKLPRHISSLPNYVKKYIGIDKNTIVNDEFTHALINSPRKRLNTLKQWGIRLTIYTNS